MKLTGGQIAVRALEDAGVSFAFGIPGTHNLELHDALAVSRQVRSVLVTHEQAAPFMADGVWRASGRLACANLVPGAGLTHALSGVAEAFLDQVPLLVLSSGIRRDLSTGYQLHDVDQRAVAAPLVKETLISPSLEGLYATIRTACQRATTGVPGPVHIEVPAEQFLFRAPFRPHGFSEPSVPREANAGDLDRAAAILNAARCPLIYVGHGARNARNYLIALAEALGAPVATTIQGKGVFPETHLNFLWPCFGPAAPVFVRRAVRECDATLAVGCRFGEVATASYGAVPPQPLIHIDIDPTVLGRNHRADVAIAADAASALRGLCERVHRRESNSRLRAMLQEGHARVRKEKDRPGRRGRVSPGRLLHGLQEQFGPDAIYTADSGNGLFQTMECLRLARPGQFLAPVDYSCMGYAVPAAIGAKLAAPDVPVIAIAGDGAFLMTGLELITAVQNALPLAVFVLRDGELGQISHFQRISLSRISNTQLGAYDLEALAKGVNADFVRIDRDVEIPAALQRVDAGLHARRVVVVDVKIDYSRKSYFTVGVMRTNLGRLPLADRLRVVGRAIKRRVIR